MRSRMVSPVCCSTVTVRLQVTGQAVLLLPVARSCPVGSDERNGRSWLGGRGSVFARCGCRNKHGDTHLVTGPAGAACYSNAGRLRASV